MKLHRCYHVNKSPALFASGCTVTSTSVPKIDSDLVPNIVTLKECQQPPFTERRTMKGSMNYGGGLDIQFHKNFRGQLSTSTEIMHFGDLKGKTQECKIDFEVPDTRPALVKLPSWDLCLRHTSIEIAVRNICALRFVATDRQHSPKQIIISKFH